MGLNVVGRQGRTGSKNRPWTLIQTGPPEPAPVYDTSAALLMHATSVFDVSSGVAREPNFLAFI